MCWFYWLMAFVVFTCACWNWGCACWFGGFLPFEACWTAWGDVMLWGSYKELLVAYWGGCNAMFGFWAWTWVCCGCDAWLITEKPPPPPTPCAAFLSRSTLLVPAFYCYCMLLLMLRLCILLVASSILFIVKILRWNLSKVERYLWLLCVFNQG